MKFKNHFHQELDQYHLLKHPFYQNWNMGKLSKDVLQIYAGQYYHHVAAFPRYISAIHSQCADIEARQILLGNLIEEEQGGENHPELWKRFAEGLGVDRDVVETTLMLSPTQALVDGYFELSRSSFAAGLGALYAYERQTPAIAQSKIEGLKKFYDVHDGESLKFFTVHLQADEWHSQECWDLIDKLNKDEKEAALQGAVSGAKLLWQFLDGIHSLNQVTYH